MKKTVSVISLLTGTLLIIITIIAETMQEKSISIIGGADVPTSVFIAGKIGGDFMLPAAAVGIVLILAGIFLIMRKK